MKRVLIIDDEQRMRRVLQILIEKIGLESRAADGGAQGLEIFAAEQIDLVLCDLKMAPMDGLEFLRRLRALDAEVPVIMLTAFGTVTTAVEAMKLGALDFVLKPFDRQALEMTIRKALDLSRAKLENRFFREESRKSRGFGETPPGAAGLGSGIGPGIGRGMGMIGESPAMQPVYDLVRQVAPTRSAVLITGETGTGKELFAHAIHDLSPRASKLFVPINCAAVPASLLESEFFGHVRGAFTGAQTDRVGKFKAADEGTLFLDELGDMDVALQAKLLRVLEDGVIEPVGSNRRVTVDVRIVSSTNRDLRAAIREGKFREDLYHRLNVFSLKLPPLRERKEDVPSLAGAFLGQFSKELAKPGLELSAGAARLLQGYAFPGNVRELRNLMERVAVLSSGQVAETLVRSLLPDDEVEAVAATDLNLDRALAVVERKLILRALADVNDNKAAAATVLGIGERTLWSKLKKHGL
jgi:two-component system response regulator AtoC